MIKIEFDGEIKELDVKKLSIKPGDILVFQNPKESLQSLEQKAVMDQSMQLIVNSLQSYLGFNVYIMILSGGLTVDTIIGDPKTRVAFFGRDPAEEEG